MADKVIIIAGGKSKRWGSEVRKYLLPVCGEPVLDRTVRLVKEIRGIDPVIIGEETQEGANQAVLYSRKFWSEDGITFILLGDVSWQKSTLENLLNNVGIQKYVLGGLSWRKGNIPYILGRAGPNFLTGRPYSEIFAFAFAHQINDKIAHYHDITIRAFPDGDWWDVLRACDLAYERPNLLVRIDLLTPRWGFMNYLARKVSYWHWLRQGRTTSSPLFFDTHEGVTDDFDEPEWYQPYLDAVEPKRLIDR